MLTKIDIENETTFFVPIALASPKDSLLIREITGLLPPPTNLFMGEYSRDGGFYQGRRVGMRNVVITLDLNPNPALGETVAGLREMLYKAFMNPLVTAEHVKINFHDDQGRVRYLVGYVESFEGEVFSIDTMVQISLLCPDPYLRDVNTTVLTNFAGWTTVPFSYEGTAKTGFIVSLEMISDVSAIKLENNGASMDLIGPFYQGESIGISTVPGQRWVIRHTQGESSSALSSLQPQSTWLQLSAQDNLMKVTGSNSLDLGVRIIELQYRQAYWGL